LKKILIQTERRNGSYRFLSQFVRSDRTDQHRMVMQPFGVRRKIKRGSSQPDRIGKDIPEDLADDYDALAGSVATWHQM
jgi:hypothetical protein